MDRSSASALDDPAHDGHIRRARGDRLAMRSRIHESAEYVPPVRNHGDEPRHDPARLQLVRSGIAWGTVPIGDK